MSTKIRFSAYHSFVQSIYDILCVSLFYNRCQSSLNSHIDERRGITIPCSSSCLFTLSIYDFERTTAFFLHVSVCLFSRFHLALRNHQSCLTSLSIWALKNHCIVLICSFEESFCLTPLFFYAALRNHHHVPLPYQFCL